MVLSIIILVALVLYQTFFFSIYVNFYAHFSVPSAPADIKAVVSSRNKILVSWLPPASPNGVLVGYTLYMSVIEDGREVRTKMSYRTHKFTTYANQN